MPSSFCHPAPPPPLSLSQEPNFGGLHFRVERVIAEAKDEVTERTAFLTSKNHPRLLSFFLFFWFAFVETLAPSADPLPYLSL